MTDDTTKRGKADRTRINTRQAFEVRYWRKAFGVTKLTLIMAVKAVGPLVKEVKQYLINRIRAAK